MVVLEEGSMLTTGHNQYLQPDYLSPLPTTLDAKKSPLALLAQTCSQIGADSPTKPLISPLDKSSKGASARSPPAAKLERARGSPSDGNQKSTNISSANNLAFKPYETNVVSTKRSAADSSDSSSRPASKASVHSASGNNNDSANSASDCIENNNNNNNNNNNGTPVHKKSRSTPVGRKSASPAQSQNARNSPSSNTERKTPAADREKSSASPKNSSGASPIIRSGMEILSGHSGKDAAANLQNMYKAGGLGPFGPNSLCCPPGLAENPAFRPPFAGASPFSHHHAAAAALLGYPGAGSANGSPYLSYARVKTPSGGESLVPVCKDPYCTGCQYSMHNAQMMMAAAAAAAAGSAAGSAGSNPPGACPSGCTQCDHQKYGLMALSSLGPMPPPLAGYPSSLAAANGGRTHVCNWIAGDSYCGKRFGTSEDLLQHLRTHTSLANGADPSAAAAILASQHSHPLLSPTAALHRAAAAASAAGQYPAPALSPLSGRYHPYGKPPAGPLPASLAASPYSAFNALGPYYSPYAIYGQRIGAAVHP